MLAYETRLGKIDVSENYLSKIIGNAVTSCFGVVGMKASGSKQKIKGVVSKDSPINTGIKVSGNAEGAVVEIHIVVTYGMNISAIAASITEKVKYVVKEATAINVDKVIVKVDDIKE